ncbi:MAG: hypothetical protein AAFP84_15885 [Actinomycetota bacterium]
MVTPEQGVVAEADIGGEVRRDVLVLDASVERDHLSLRRATMRSTVVAVRKS